MFIKSTTGTNSTPITINIKNVLYFRPGNRKDETWIMFVNGQEARINEDYTELMKTLI